VLALLFASVEGAKVDMSKHHNVEQLQVETSFGLLAQVNNDLADAQSLAESDSMDDQDAARNKIMNLKKTL